MYEKLKEAFDQIQAEEELKSRTKEYIFHKTNGYTQKKAVNYRVLLSAAACMMLFVFSGHWIYFTPTTEISIDINPSMELAVNRFDRVISVDGYNDDGEELAASLDIKYMNYSDAVNEIIESDAVTSLLSENEIMSITVTGTSEAQSSKVLSDIQSCTREHKNTYCYSARSEDVESAHELGLSYGKYKAFLELQSLNPDITVSDIQNMTMREIKDLTDKLSAKKNNNTSSDNSGQKQKQNPKHGQKNSKRQSQTQNKKQNQTGNKGKPQGKRQMQNSANGRKSKSNQSRQQHGRQNRQKKNNL